MEKGEASLQTFSGVKIPSALEFSVPLPIASELQTRQPCLAVCEVLHYKNRGKGFQTEFGLIWLGEGGGNEGPASKMGYSTPFENKVPRKSANVDTQSHLEVLEI